MARSPVPALVPDLPNAPDAGVDEDGLSVSSSVLSTSLSPRLRDTVGGDKIIRSLQPSTAVAASVNDERGIDELAGLSVPFFAGHGLKFLKTSLKMLLKTLDAKLFGAPRTWESSNQHVSVKKATHHT